MRALILAMIMTHFCACQGGFLRNVRSATYPPSFHYITKEEVHTTMGQLAVEIQSLDQAMQKVQSTDTDDRETVIEILKRLKTLAHDLKTGTRSNHPRIDFYAPILQSNIQSALSAVELNPPNYYEAGVLAGSCTMCHEVRHIVR